jgi:hypothetical protein
MKRAASALAVLSLSVAASYSAHAQTRVPNQPVSGAGTVAAGAINGVGNTVGTVGNTAQGVVGSLQPTLQPVTQGVGGALDNLTQPQTVSSLLEFLAGVIPNHIEAHVNLDSLRVDKLTVDVRGVDLRNLRVDLLVANSRNAGTVRSALPSAGSASSDSSSAANTPNPSILPGDGPIAGSSTRR